AALRPVLRHRRRDPAAGVRRRLYRTGVELRGIRERNLSIGAPGDSRRTARSRADAGTEHAADPHPHPRAAGVPSRPGADDERLHRAAEGLIARLRPDGDGADEADADLRDEPRQLGDSRHALRGAIPRDVTVAGGARLAARAAVEGGDAMTTPVLDVRDLQLRRGARDILRGVSFTASPGEIVVIMGSSGSGKTTILRAIAGLERQDGGQITIASGRAGMVFQFHCLFEHLSA